MARGFVKKRGEVWYAYWRDRAGKQHAKAVGPRKKDAEAFLVSKQKEVNENTFRELTKIKFPEYCEVWLRDYAALQVKPSTLANQKCVINSSLIPFFGNVPLTSITSQDVQKYVAHRIEEGKAPATASKALTLLKTMFKWAVEWGYLSHNPAERVKPPRKQREEMDFLKPGEIRALLDALDDEWRPFFHTAIFTGMRLGELMALQWSDIDWNSSTIHVRRSVWGGKFQEPKTRSSYRAIGMAPSLAKELQVWRQVAPHSDMGLVFCNAEGGFLDKSNLRNRVFNPALERAGLRRIRIHDLRHTFASLLINQGENLKYVQQQLGHSSITTTVDRYGHLMPDIRANASARLDATVFDAA